MGLWKNEPEIVKERRKFINTFLEKVFLFENHAEELKRPGEIKRFQIVTRKFFAENLPKKTIRTIRGNIIWNHKTDTEGPRYPWSRNVKKLVRGWIVSRRRRVRGGIRWKSATVRSKTGAPPEEQALRTRAKQRLHKQSGKGTTQETNNTVAAASGL